MNEEKNEQDFLNTVALKYFGIRYLFPYQRLVVTNILEAAGEKGFTPEPMRNSVTGEMEVYDTNRHQIVILPTGAGKSLCFMLPVPLIKGITLVVFPLLSLIADQARRLIRDNFHPSILRGGQTDAERDEIWANLEKGRSKILLSNPETLLQENILERLKDLRIKHLVVDEMHIVSEWGDTFRPSYLDISRIYREADIDVVTAFTATASETILARVKEILFPVSSPAVITSDPDRPNIHYKVLRSISKSQDLYNIATNYQKPMVVFCRSRTGTELTARYLRRKLNSNNIFFYHAGLSKEEKKVIENWFFESTDGILTSTCAYGMGVDKKNIRTVVHMDPSPSVEAYLQESGRAGRDRKVAEAVLLVSYSDFLDAGRIKDSVLRKRYLDFLYSITDNSVCRRKSLLKLLGAGNDNCSGCDVCRGEIQESVSGYDEITGYVRRNSRKSILRKALLTLSGSKYPEVYLKNYCRSPFYGALINWTQEDIKEGIVELMKMKVISIPKRGPYKRLLIFNYSFSIHQKRSDPSQAIA